MSATSLLIAMNLLIALAMTLVGARPEHSAGSLQLAWGANFAPATTDGEWWRLATAMFMHFGIVLLLMNMFALWDSGRLVERLFGTIRFIAIYFASGLIGNLVSLIVHGDRAVSGGARLCTPMSKVSSSFRACISIPMFRLRQRWSGCGICRHQARCSRRWPRVFESRIPKSPRCARAVRRAGRETNAWRMEKRSRHESVGVKLKKALRCRGSVNKTVRFS
ncbi:MAG: rhomboid family intramembrane serine protease [Sulfuritalea sp.]|nr:rhomboid family intramembrane serine protease [Sulfuritalea sp.]